MYVCTSLVIVAFCGLVAWVAWLTIRQGGSPPREEAWPDTVPPWLDDEAVVREPSK